MLTTDKFLEIIEEAGIENVVFLLPMSPLNSLLGFYYTTSSDEKVIVPARITEERYKLSDRHKITLESIYEVASGGITGKIIENVFGKNHLYIMDLTSMIDQGYVKMFVKPVFE